MCVLWGGALVRCSLCAVRVVDQPGPRAAPVHLLMLLEVWRSARLMRGLGRAAVLCWATCVGLNLLTQHTYVTWNAVWFMQVLLSRLAEAPLLDTEGSGQSTHPAPPAATPQPQEPDLPVDSNGDPAEQQLVRLAQQHQQQQQEMVELQVRREHGPPEPLEDLPHLQVHLLAPCHM